MVFMRKSAQMRQKRSLYEKSTDQASEEGAISAYVMIPVCDDCRISMALSLDIDIMRARMHIKVWHR